MQLKTRTPPDRAALQSRPDASANTRTLSAVRCVVLRVGTVACGDQPW
jgi:hypothetical protein